MYNYTCYTASEHLSTFFEYTACMCCWWELLTMCRERWLGLTLQQFASHLNNAAPALKEGGGLCPHCAIVHYCIQYLSALETALCEIYCSALEMRCLIHNRECVTCKGGLGLPSQGPQTVTNVRKQVGWWTWPGSALQFAACSVGSWWNHPGFCSF